MMSREEIASLKACPFCGGAATAENYVIEAVVRCEACRAKITRPHGTYDDNGLPEAIEAWNGRVLSLLEVEGGKSWDSVTQQAAPASGLRGDEAQHSDGWKEAAKDLIDALADERDLTLKLRAALEEAEEVFSLCEHPRHVDPIYGAEVQALGERIGYGAMMSSAQASWRAKLESSGYPAGGEHVSGPCFGTVQHTLKIIRAALQLDAGAARTSEASGGSPSPDAPLPNAIERTGEGGLQRQMCADGALPVLTETPAPSASFACAARANPEDCGWPFCGCDPAADRVLESIQEHYMAIVPLGDPRLKADILQILTESCRGELHGATAAILERIAEGPAIEPPTPLGALKFRMEQGGHTQADLAKLIGSRGRASEILSGKRSLSKAHIRLLVDEWGIPARSLLGSAEPAATSNAANGLPPTLPQDNDKGGEGIPGTSTQTPERMEPSQGGRA